MRLVKLERTHLDEMLSIPGNERVKEAYNKIGMDIVFKQRLIYAVFSGAKLIMCGGVNEYWKNRGEAWAILRPDRTKKEMLKLHRTVERFLNGCPVRRIEATILRSFAAGHKWVQKLGFELEAPILKKYAANGEDYSLYARLKE